MSKHEDSNTVSLGTCPTCGGLAQFIEGGTVRHVNLRSAIEQETEARVLETAARVCEDNQFISGGPGPLFGAGWNAAVEHTAKAIRNLSPKNLPTSPKSVEGWRSANEPPAGPPDTWTRDVVALTNYGDVFMLAYYHGKDGGTWQRPARFNKGEEVAWWIAQPIQASPDTDLSVSGEVIGGQTDEKGRPMTYWGGDVSTEGGLIDREYVRVPVGLDPQSAKEAAQRFRRYLAAFNGRRFDDTDPDQQNLAMALDNLEEASAMLLHLAYRAAEKGE